MASNYKNLTDFIYQELAWGPIYKIKDGNHVANMDNKSEVYIKESLKIMKIQLKDLRKKKVFNIGTGRESRFFAKHGADVTHLDIGTETVKQMNLWAKKNKKKVHSFSADIKNADIGVNKYDIIFLSGIYQHIEKPAFALIKFINALKVNGKMYMGFYRSGEFKYFIVDAIRYILKKKQLFDIRCQNSIYYTLADFNNYQSSRVMDDFFVPKKHNFHPRDIIHDLKLMNAKILYFDNDFRDYSHNGTSYFSIGGDRIYVQKKFDKIYKKNELKNKLKTLTGKNQLLEVSYKEKIINVNIKLIKLIKKKLNEKKIRTQDVNSLCIGLYQLTRPKDPEKSEYYDLLKKKGRHILLNNYLKNFLKNFDQSKKSIKLFNTKLIGLGLK